MWGSGAIVESYETRPRKTHRAHEAATSQRGPILTRTRVAFQGRIFGCINSFCLIVVYVTGKSTICVRCSAPPNTTEVGVGGKCGSLELALSCLVLGNVKFTRTIELNKVQLLIGEGITTHL